MPRTAGSKTSSKDLRQRSVRSDVSAIGDWQLTSGEALATRMTEHDVDQRPHVWLTSCSWRKYFGFPLAMLPPIEALIAVALALSLGPAAALQPGAEALANISHNPADALRSPPQSVDADRSNAYANSSLALLPSTMPPRVVIGYLGSSADARSRAQAIAHALSEKGVEVADVRESAVVIRTELDFYYVADQAVAQRIGGFAGIQPTRAALEKDGLTPQPGAMLLSVSGR